MFGAALATHQGVPKAGAATPEDSRRAFDALAPLDRLQGAPAPFVDGETMEQAALAL